MSSLSPNEIICPVKGCNVVCKDMATLDEHKLSHRDMIGRTIFAPKILTGTPDPQDAVPSTSGMKPSQPAVREELALIEETTYRPTPFSETQNPQDAIPSTSRTTSNQKVVREDPSLTQQRRRDAPMELDPVVSRVEQETENSLVFSDISSDEEIEVVKVVKKKKKLIGLTYKQIELIQLDNEKNEGNGTPLIYWQHVENGEQNSDNNDTVGEFACNEEGCNAAYSDLTTLSEHQLSHAYNEDAEQYEDADEAEGNASVLSNSSPSVGDLEDIEQIQQDLIGEMTEVRRAFLAMIRRVDRMRPEIVRLKRLVDGAGRIPDSSK